MRKKAIVVFLLVFTGLLVFCFWWYWQGLKSKGGSIVKEVEIPAQIGDEEVSVILFRKGLIKSPYVFRIYAFLTGKDKKIKAGTYLLNSDLSVPEILDTLVQGEVLTYKVTVPEGLSIEEVDIYLKEKYAQYGFQKGDFKEAVRSFVAEAKEKFPAVADKIEEFGLEGFLLGDTYFLKTDKVPQRLVSKMIFNFENKAWSVLNQDLSKPLSDPYQALVLASLVEKEAKTEKDRRLVAGIFLKRLENNDFLQSCASINYVLSEKKKVLSSSDLSIDSPYNTYKNKGLPPAPIASPSLESIEAVFNPLFSQYYYFLSDQNGKLYFSATYEEHLELRERIIGKGD